MCHSKVEMERIMEEKVIFYATKRPLSSRIQRNISMVLMAYNKPIMQVVYSDNCSINSGP